MPLAKEEALKTKAIRYPEADERFQKCLRRVHDLMHEFAGDLHELEAALGFMFIGYYYGWKVLHVIHSKKTVRKYEALLSISIKEEFADVGPYANKSNGWRIIQKISNFWKVINGEIDSTVKPEERSIAT